MLKLRRTAGSTKIPEPRTGREFTELTLANRNFQAPFYPHNSQAQFGKKRCSEQGAPNPKNRLGSRDRAELADKKGFAEEINHFRCPLM